MAQARQAVSATPPDLGAEGRALSGLVAQVKVCEAHGAEWFGFGSREPLFFEQYGAAPVLSLFDHPKLTLS